MNSSEIKIAWIWLSQNLSPSGHCAGFSLGFSIYHKYTNNNYFSIENATKMWIDAFSSLFRRQDKKNTQDLILGWLSQPQQQRLTRLILKSNSKFSFLSKSYEDTPTKMKKRDSKKLDRKFHWTDRIGKSQPSLCGDYTWLPLTRQCWVLECRNQIWKTGNETLSTHKHILVWIALCSTQNLILGCFYSLVNVVYVGAVKRTTLCFMLFSLALVTIPCIPSRSMLRICRLA